MENGDDSPINRGVNDFTNFDLNTSQNNRDNPFDASIFNDDNHRENLSPTDLQKYAESKRFFRNIFKFGNYLRL